VTCAGRHDSRQDEKSENIQVLESIMPPTGEIFDPALIIFAALAIFICWKLRSVLGVRVDRDALPPAHFNAGPIATSPARPMTKPRPQAEPDGAERWRGVAEKDSAGWRGLDEIAKAEANFDGAEFIEGARRAYEMIVSAFAKGDRDSLRPLLSTETYDVFAQEISKRELSEETLETAVVAIDVATVSAARVLAQRIEVTVRFEARLMSVRRDKNGETIDGGRTIPVIELWTFARDPRAQDPNWKLIATHAAG
jgi:predicted lipid-binding transport protein (Tim44 family)